ncbi:NADH-quinone oxidoreductase subunit H [Candidatus Promineifilum breve]|uniref:NADH-quinone oxidoreductase subunit H n=1 Tax=Candidatus Promineifilum breve TaxID=1806508 RepID=A0A160T545_9CHLR|nr:NADH-quinone oxidoreductase subunit NuoH [Candidatus Promineifilum breve]CUS04569.2 NADH-quinone oxidoreductase subunit H [Candidatus Promineifilum breve]
MDILLDLLKSLLSLSLGDFIRRTFGEGPGTELLIDIGGVVLLSTFCLLIVIFLIWLTRKLVARMQDRIGPNRVGGRFGLLQTVADVVKLLIKEVIHPSGADWVAYNAAPILTVIAALLVWAVMPFAPGVIGVDLNIGIFYVLAISSASVVVLLLAGWGSNNKYALLGAFRAVAQMVSYEVPMILALLVPIILAGTMSTKGIIDAQTIPFLFVAPLSALIFYISTLAETGRTPFDLLEAESEIVAGFHTEYGGMKFGMFFLAEFVTTLFWSGMFVTIYLGGYRFFGLENWVSGDGYPYGRLIGLIAFFAKTFFIYFVYDWVRGTLPRVRVDQILNFNWKFLVPLSLVLIFAVAIVDKLIPAGAGPVARMAIHLALNLLLALGTLQILRRRGRQVREAMTGGDGPGGRETLHSGGHDGHATHGSPAAHGSAGHGEAGDSPLGAREPITVPIH